MNLENIMLSRKDQYKYYILFGLYAVPRIVKIHRAIK